MTIIDALLQLDPNPSLITTTRTSTNILDLLNGRDLGVGDATGATPKLLCQVVQAFAGGTSIQVQFQTAPDNGSGAPGTFTTSAQSDVYLTAELVPGTRMLEIDVPRVRNGANLPRFYQLNYIVAGTMTAGAVTADIVLTDQASVRKNGYVGGYPAGVIVPN